MTRRELARMSGVPERSLQDIEAGKFNLGEEVAMRISLATYVDPKSLMRNDDPLLDWVGKPLGEGKVDFKIDIKPESIHGMAQQVLFDTLWEVAAAKHRSLVLSYAFEKWVETTVRLLDLEKFFSERLTEKFTRGLVRSK
jgi:transcriptional regulator with XRE-family HTH domain